MFPLALLLLVQLASSSQLPDCSDPTTYTISTTLYKGVSDTTIWDRNRSTSANCSLNFSPPPAPTTCGDCDFARLADGVWYRFADPYVQLMEYADTSACPTIRGCNGYYSMNLVQSSLTGPDPRSRYYGLLWRRTDNTCLKTSIVDTSIMVESYDCTTFLLYKFPAGLNSSAVYCNYEHLREDPTTVYPTPYSFCMNDTVTPLSLTGNRRLYNSISDTMRCSVTRSPTSPPPVSWSDTSVVGDLDTANSGLYTAVYEADPHPSLTTVRCESGGLTHTFYKVTLETRNVTIRDPGEFIEVNCSVRVSDTTAIQDQDVSLTGVADPEGTITVTRGEGVIALQLKYQNQFNYQNVTHETRVTDTRNCAVTDPLSLTSYTSSFEIVLVQSCPGGSGVTADTTCQPCLENHFSRDGECVPCPDGQLSDPGSVSCNGGSSSHELLAYVGGGLAVVALVAVVAAVLAIRYVRNKRFTVQSANDVPMNRANCRPVDEDPSLAYD